MRDIIDKLTLLTESTGLAGRKPGDVFKNSQGEEAIFNQIKFFPEGGGKFTPEELAQELKQASTEHPNIQWQNKNSAKTGGFALASFSTDNGELIIGRFLDNVKPSPTDNYVPNSFGDYKFGGKAAAKTQSGLTPQDLLKKKIDLSIADIMNQLAESLGTSNPLYAVAHRIALGEPLPMTFPAPEGISFTAFRDYFCEILQPIALQKGQWTGNAGEAAKKFLDGGFENTLISFDDTKTAGLSDSIMTNDSGQFIKVSTKGGKGATASVKNLLDSLEDLKTTSEGKKLLKKHGEVIEMVEQIKNSGQAGAPLYLGVKFGIIDEEDKTKIENLKNSGLTSIKNIKSLGLSKKLQSLATSRETDNPDNVNLYYHLIAAVAHKAAEHVNSSTNFSKAASDILNNGALIQVYTKATEGKETWKLTSFDTVYPGDSIKGVYLSAGKTYYSTGIKGNFTFKIDRGEGKPKKEENNEVSTSFSDEDFADKASDIVNLKHDNSKIKPTSISDVGDVGRKKRK